MSIADIKPGSVVDFARMLRQLKLKGYGVDLVSIHANLSKTAVRNYITGTVPLHPNGERIIDLWCQVMGLHRSAAPIRADLPTVTRSRFLQKHITVRG